MDLEINTSHLASICLRSARVRYCSWLWRATPRPESRLLPSAVPASVLLVITEVAPASVNSAACLRSDIGFNAKVQG